MSQQVGARQVRRGLADLLAEVSRADKADLRNHAGSDKQTRQHLQAAHAVARDSTIDETSEQQWPD